MLPRSLSGSPACRLKSNCPGPVPASPIRSTTFPSRSRTRISDAPFVTYSRPSGPAVRYPATANPGMFSTPCVATSRSRRSSAGDASTTGEDDDRAVGAGESKASAKTAPRSGPRPVVRRRHMPPQASRPRSGRGASGFVVVDRADVGRTRVPPERRAVWGRRRTRNLATRGTERQVRIRLVGAASMTLDTGQCLTPAPNAATCSEATVAYGSHFQPSSEHVSERDRPSRPTSQ